MLSVPKRITLALGLGLALASQTLFAAPLVDIQETREDAITTYTITNNAELPIAVFGITNPLYATASTTRPNWNRDVLSKQSWNSGHLIDSSSEYGYSYIFLTGQLTQAWRDEIASFGLDPDSVIALGTFEEAFGSDNPDEFAYLFWESNASGNYIQAGETSSEFAALPPPASEYAAWTKGGELIYRSYAVPEPATLALMGIGLLGLMGTGRRRQG